MKKKTFHWYHLLNPFFTYRLYKTLTRFKRACDHAELRSSISGTTFLVLPMLGGGLMVADRYNIRKAKREGRIDTSYSHISLNPNMRDVQRECFYYTAHKGMDPMPPSIMERKKRQYLSWALGMHF